MGKYLIILVFMATFLSASCSSQATIVAKTAEQVLYNSTLSGPLPPHPFQSDGCSGWLDGNWLECCVKHDLLYWLGGTGEERKAADLALRECLTEQGHPYVGQVMFLGVRVGGVWWLPTPFRWGFGWDYPDKGPPGKEY